MALPFEDSRRLTGPNLHFAACGAGLEALGPLAQEAEALDAWARLAVGLASDLGWGPVETHVRRHATGASLALSAPPDQLLTATEVAEWAWMRTLLDCGAFERGQPFAPGHPSVEDRAQALATLRSLAAAEAAPRMAALVAAADAHGLPVFTDETRLILGGGGRARSWSLDHLPEPEAVPWAELGTVPTALVTGSNGKTTTVRLVSAMLAEAGLLPGHNCTDGIFIGGAWEEKGDWSGPLGARRILGDPRVQGAVLETARGGILRRGLGVRRAEAALVTNISPDHFGEYGIHDLDGLAQTKLVVGRAVAEAGVLVLNADDPNLLRRGMAHGGRSAWFALDAEHPHLAAHRARGGATCGVAGGRLLLHARGADHDLGEVAALPLTLGGSARYNIANLAGAALVAQALGVSPEAIARVAARFGARRQDNPGRLERWDLRGVTVLMDYAHNVEGLEGLLDVAQRLRGEGRLGLLLGQAGNREDDAIRALVPCVAQAHPSFIVLKDLGGYLRGRQPGEVPEILRGELLRLGVPGHKLATILSETAAARAALAWARPGDVLVLPVHALDARAKVSSLLDSLAEASWTPGTPLPPG